MTPTSHLDPRGPACVARVRIVPPDRVLDDSVTVQADAGRVHLTDETALHTVVLPPAQARAIGRALLDAAAAAEAWGADLADARPADGLVLAPALDLGGLR